MRSAKLPIMAGALIVGIASLTGTPSAAGRPVRVIDVEAEDCTQIPPQEIPPPAVSVDEQLPVEARVLVEASDLPVAKTYMAVARDSFARIGIVLKLRFQTVSTPDEWSEGTGIAPGPSQPEIFDFMKSLFGGERPAGTDVVYFMTSHWDGGFADCIGGVRFPDRAFAFGSIDYATEGMVPSPTANEGVIAAHEIGHLLGAHHHYSNCVEALPSGAIRGDVNPCTTMWPAAANASSTFGILERSFIRSYAAAHAEG